MIQADLILVYGTVGCHLCEQAEALLTVVLERRGLNPRVSSVDIADHDELQNRFGEKIPVVERLDTGGQLDWPFGASELDDFLS